MSHKSTPVLKMRNIRRETSFADFVFQVFVNWGMNAIVVRHPAINPMTVAPSIVGIIAVQRLVFYFPI